MSPQTRRSANKSVRTNHRRRHTFETLEPRAMLAADPGWAFGLGGPLWVTSVADLVVNTGPDQHVYVAGSFRNTVDFDPGPGTTNLVTNQNAQDGFIAKYTQQGALVWVKQFGQATPPVGVGNEFATDLEFDAAGDVYVSGFTNAAAPKFGSTTLTGQGSWDAFVTKVDAATGTFLWTQSIGGAGDDRAHDLNVSAAGDVYVTGSFQSTVDFDPSPSTTFSLTSAGESDAYVWKLDSQGSLVWARQFSGLADEFGHRVVTGDDGYAYAVGTFRDTTDFGEPGNPLLLTSATPNVASIYFVKLDEAAGNSIWAQQLTGTAPVVAARLLADGAGSLYLAGLFSGDMSFAMGGPTLSSAGGQDGFVSKWDADGNVAWAAQLASGAGDLILGKLNLAGDGGLLFGYGFEGTADFDPGPGVAQLTSNDGMDGAVVRLNSDGSLAWLRHVSGPGTTWANDVVTDSLGNVYATGFYEFTATLPTGHVLNNPGTGLTFNPGSSQFVMKLAFGDPTTKFYVVDDATANRTFEYQSSGVSGDNSSLPSGNTAPRGAASTAAGDRVWVVDANRKVFVYDINGNLLGSWTAGTLASNATPEGIATNGTDIWIVDSRNDRVYRYAGAASRLSGSQNAASNFALNSGNSNPKDVVTDGSSLWVVDDAAKTDKVFKYSVVGSLQGSWTMTGAGSQPTGITIDPANVSDVWIVDAGTDRVYQYTAAASRTSGSQTASSSFALAAGNTNPQGIADPPIVATVHTRDATPAATAVDVSDKTVVTIGRAVEAGLDNGAMEIARSRTVHRPVVKNTDTTAANLLAVAADATKAKTWLQGQSPDRAAAIDEALSEMTLLRWPRILDEILPAVC